MTLKVGDYAKTKRVFVSDYGSKFSVTVQIRTAKSVHICEACNSDIAEGELYGSSDYEKGKRLFHICIHCLSYKDSKL